MERAWLEVHRAGYKPIPTTVNLNGGRTCPQGNRIINPSFRRKPESRNLGSRHTIFR